MPLSPGERLGPYEIVSLLGKGGMGEVYRALDTRLRREVALKVSAQQFSERFEREARAVAALNHPNICTLYDIGPNYLAWNWSKAGTSPNGSMKEPYPSRKLWPSPGRSATLWKPRTRKASSIAT
jgi:serine/threonine protein kinase